MLACMYCTCVYVPVYIVCVYVPVRVRIYVYMYPCVCECVFVCQHTFQPYSWGKQSVLIPAEVCLNFSLFFFLHFQGFSSRPRVANLLRRRMGGLWAPGTSDSERMAASLSTSSAVGQDNAEYKKTGELRAGD